jgi:hypothetical protein
MVLARSAAPFSASIVDCLCPVYFFDGVCLVSSSIWWAYVQCMLTCPMAVEEEKKDRIHDQNGGGLNWYMSSKDIHDRQNASRVLSPHRWSLRSAPSPVALGLGGGPWPLAGGWFRILCLGCFSMSSFEMVRWRLHLEIGIRFSPLYPCFGGASSAIRGRVQVCVLQISWDLVVFMFVSLVSG